MKLSALSLAVAAIVATSAQADSQAVERLQVIGSKQAVTETPGSAYYMSEEELAEFEYTDVMRALGNVPGVYVLEEDGYGLRPNIGMRGTGVNRSDKITQMEDGVLSAPAPYSAPAAYYFPTFARIQALEVLKGSSSIQYGPRTTGGVLNMVSRQIPNQPFAGMLDLSAGQDGYGKGHVWAGGQGDRVGAVVEALRYEADGFKDVPNGDSGFVRHDLMTKVGIALDQAGNHQFEMKLKYSDETSDDTYMGVTQSDYAQRPYARYGASQLDVMDTEHKQLQATYQWNLGDGARLTTVAYRNEFARNWYKADRVDGLGLSSGGIERASVFDNEAQPGETLSVRLKNNNRDYLSQGIQAQFDMPWQQHDLSVGLRYHEDSEDRFQWTDMFELNSSQIMSLTEAGTPGTDANRKGSAEALAGFAKGRFYLGEWTIDAGFRVEDIDTYRRDWGADLARVGAPAQRVNSTTAVLPSLGATYRLNDSMVLLTGLQQGFAPASAGNEGQDNEESWNYEAGLRYSANNLMVDAIAFYSDYDNMHGNCTAAQGCNLDSIGAQVNAGEVEVYGAELLGQYSFELSPSLQLMLDGAYTYTQAEFQNSFNSNIGIWGNVTAGDSVPYQPDHQLRLGASLTANAWQAGLNARYMSEMRTVAGTGSIDRDERIDSRVVLDASARYHFDDRQQVYISIDNLLDETYITTRMHGGIMVGKPRTAHIGYRYRF